MILAIPALALSLAYPAPDAITCSVTDGDTIRCGEERIRITAIDAPETRACRRGRQCVAGDGQAQYIERWDDDGLVAADCPHLALSAAGPSA